MLNADSGTVDEFSATIIVPSRGGRSHLPSLMEALGRQDGADFEVIVVLDGDVDSSEEFLKEVADECNFPLRSIVFVENRGRVSALNAGATAARGRILIRCDDDLLPAPDYVSGHLSHHNGAPRGVIGLCRNVYPDTVHARVYGKATDKTFRHAAMATPADGQWHYWGGNVSIPRSVHLLLNGYDTRYKTYGWEDVDFGYRLHLMGVPVHIDEALTTDHRVAATTTTIRALRALHSGAARETFVKIHGPGVLAAVRPVGTWGILVKGVGRAINEKSIKSFGWAVDGISPLIPRYVSKKLMALVIESAGYAGNVFPDRARAIF